MGDPNPFRSRQEEREEETRVLKCILCNCVMNKMTPDQQLQLAEVWDDEEIIAETIVDVMKGWGMKTNTTTIRTHRSRKKHPELSDHLLSLL